MSLWLTLWHDTLWESSAYGPWGPIWDNPFDVVVGDVGSLRALYDATDGDHWTDNTNWLSGKILADWYGVTVDGIRVDRVALDSNNLDGTLDNWTAPARLGYAGLRLSNNTNLLGDISTWILPDTLQNVEAYNTGLSGDISGVSWPSEMTALNLSATNVSGDMSGFTIGADVTKVILDGTNITGSVAAWTMNSKLKTLNLGQTAMTGALPSLPSSTTILDIADTTISVDLSSLAMAGAFLRAFLTGCTLTGTPDFSAAAKLQYFHVDDCGLSQAAVDNIIGEFYDNRAVFTGPNEIKIGGTNSAPSGIYQYAATPSTGKEKIYALVNDDDAEGFNTWTITYTA
jgi:hypothetical protein